MSLWLNKTLIREADIVPWSHAQCHGGKTLLLVDMWHMVMQADEKVKKGFSWGMCAMPAGSMSTLMRT